MMPIKISLPLIIFNLNNHKNKWNFIINFFGPKKRFKCLAHVSTYRSKSKYEKMND